MTGDSAYIQNLRSYYTEGQAFFRSSEASNLYSYYTWHRTIRGDIRVVCYITVLISLATDGQRCKVKAQIMGHDLCLVCYITVLISLATDGQRCQAKAQIMGHA